MHAAHGRHNIRVLQLHVILQDAQGLLLPPYSTSVYRLHLSHRPLQVYSEPEVADMAGHLMVYPYHVSETGAITYLGSEFLPDTKTAKVTSPQRLFSSSQYCGGLTQRVKFAGVTVPHMGKCDVSRHACPGLQVLGQKSPTLPCQLTT